MVFMHSIFKKVLPVYSNSEMCNSFKFISFMNHRNMCNFIHKANQENELYELSIEWLNKMFNKILSTKERKNVLKYLLPCGFTAKDARPRLLNEKLYATKEPIYIKNGVPLYPAYYTPAPRFQNHLYKALYLNSLPIIKTAVDSSSLPIKTKQFEFIIDKRKLDFSNENIDRTDYETFHKLLLQLNQRPDSDDFEFFLSLYRKSSEKQSISKPSNITLNNEMIRKMGYRKSSIADVKVTRGSGRINVNGLSLDKYFLNPLNRETAMSALYEVGDNNFDIEANVIGGGFSGQAGAIRNAIANSLIAFNKDWEDILKNAKFLCIDNRVSERKKYARHSARKRYTWVPR